MVSFGGVGNGELVSGELRSRELGKVITLNMMNMSARNEVDRRQSVRLQNNGELSSGRHGAKWVCIAEIV